MNKWRFLALLAALSFLVGCKPATKQGVRVASSVIRSDVNTGSNVYTNNCNLSQNNVYGAFYDEQSPFNFQDKVKDFLSASTNPEAVGNISGYPTENTGVRFQLKLKLNSNGSVNLSQSKISILVYDSYVGQYSSSGDLNQPIPVNISAASAGQFNLGTGYVVFKDQYGEIRLDGTYNSYDFKGRVSYKNYVTVISGASPSAGVLGQFYIATCGSVQ